MGCKALPYSIAACKLSMICITLGFRYNILCVQLPLTCKLFKVIQFFKVASGLTVLGWGTEIMWVDSNVLHLESYCLPYGDVSMNTCATLSRQTELSPGQSVRALQPKAPQLESMSIKISLTNHE